jgi:methyl coenzyme M reductase subunit D
MHKNISIRLNTNPEQLLLLKELQRNYVAICNAISPVAQASRCWNRVILHHMVYHKMREQFPNTGSQMICNAIYSVCHICRIMFQHPNSPWNVETHPVAKLPAIVFLEQTPVFFDRHTLNLKGNQLSMYTLNGRIRFALELSDEDQRRFHEEKLKEILLVNDAAGFGLNFHFAHDEKPSADLLPEGQWPENILVTPDRTNGDINQAVANAS